MTDVRLPWLESRLAPAVATRRLRMGDRSALFCERRQQLFELNPTADIIWRGLVAGQSPAEVAADLERMGASPAEALQFVATAAWEWLQTGRLAPASVMAQAAAETSVTYGLRIDALELSLGLHASAGDRLPDAVEDTFRQFVGPRPVVGPKIAVVADGGVYFVLLDGQPHGAFGPTRIVPELKAIVTDHLTRCVGDGSFLLHAALLASEGRGLLISGAPGAGKTTLTLALASRGLGYASDDIVKVSATGRFEGVPFSPASKAGAWPLLSAYLPNVDDLPTHLRNDGQEVRYVPVGDFASGAVDQLGWTLLLDRRAGAAATLERLDPLAVLTELLAAALSADRALSGATLEAFADQLSRADCRRLVYSDLAEAITAIEAMVRVPTPA